MKNDHRANYKWRFAQDALQLFLILFYLLLGFGMLNAQSITTQNLLVTWDNMTTMVVETAKKMPEESYTYRPSMEIRSFAEQVNHITMSNIGLGSMVFGRKPSFSLPSKRNPPTDKHSVIDFLEKSFSYFRENLQQFDDTELQKTIKWGPPKYRRDITTLQGFLMIFSHMQLEYGKMTIYARANDIVPHPSKGWSF